MHVETLAIGDELLTGKISDTNSTFVGESVFNLGIRLNRQTVVADDESAMIEALTHCAERSDATICFGGLGPTSDDKTVEVFAKLTDDKVVEDPASKERLYKRYRARGREVTAPSLKQVTYPSKSQVLPNLLGAAPGFTAKIGECDFYFLPGVPSEMKAMFEKSVVPRLVERFSLSEKDAIVCKTWYCLGLPESELQRQVTSIETELPEQAWLGFRTMYPENHLVLYVKGRRRQDSELMEEIGKKVSSRLAPWCFSEDQQTLEQKVISQLRQKQQVLGLVESCTGGLVMHRLTQVPGASDVIWAGVSPYQYKSKKALLSVDVPNESEAVSARCSDDLAKSMLLQYPPTVVAAITGFMGPTGGSPKDPVGTIYLNVQGEQILEERRVLVEFPRPRLQWASSSFLLGLLLTYLKEKC